MLTDGLLNRAQSSSTAQPSGQSLAIRSGWSCRPCLIVGEQNSFLLFKYSFGAFIFRTNSQVERRTIPQRGHVPVVGGRVRKQAVVDEMAMKPPVLSLLDGNYSPSLCFAPAPQAAHSDESTIMAARGRHLCHESGGTIIFSGMVDLGSSTRAPFDVRMTSVLET